jgi:MFS family permease
MAPMEARRAVVRPGGLAPARWGTLAAVCLAYVAFTVDFVAVAVALPAIQRPVAQGGLGASFPELEWVLEAFVLAIAALVLVAGYLADIVGRPLVMLAGIWVFAFTSLSASFSGSAYALVASRVGQGVGAALVLATAPVLLTEVFEGGPGKAALAAWGTVTALAVAASPAIGGVVTEELGWRWLFGFEAAAAGLAFLCAQATIGRSLAFAVPGGPGRASEGRQGRADWRGVGLFTAAIAIAVVGLVRTTSTPGEWAESGVLACFACSALLLASFVAVESVAPAPVLNISLFRERTFSGASAAALGLSAAVLGPVLLLVLYLSYDLGKSPLSAGAALALLTGMTVPMFALGGRLERWLPVKWLICSGLALVALGFWLLSRSLGAAGPGGATVLSLAPGLLVAGAGLELVSPRLSLAAAATVQPALAAQASRAASTFRHLGAAIGLAVAGSLFVSRLTAELSRAISLPAAPPAATLVLQGRLALAARGAPGGPAAALATVRESSSYALHAVFLLASVVALGSAVAALLVRAGDLAGTVEVTLPAGEAKLETPAAAMAAPAVPRGSTGSASSVATVLASAPARRPSSLLSVRGGQVTKLASLQGPPGPPLGHLYGAVKSEDGAWVPEVRVVLRDALGTLVASSLSDGAGSYHFLAVPAGRYSLATVPCCNGAREEPGGQVEVIAGKAIAVDLLVRTGAPKATPGASPGAASSWKAPARQGWAP